MDTRCYREIHFWSAVRDLADAKHRRLEAVDALLAHARDLPAIAAHFAPKEHRTALNLIRGHRIYCFEQNRQLWPDGLWYMLDREYELWLDHRIAFTHDRLVGLGVNKWASSAAIRTRWGDGFLPMASDCFQYYPRRSLRTYAQLVARAALAYEANTEAEKQVQP